MVIENCTVIKFSEEGIYVEDENVYIENCRIEKCESGILVLKSNKI